MPQFPNFQQAQSFQKNSTSKFLEIHRTTAPGSEQLDLRIHAISTTLSKLEGKRSETYRKSEVEDELEGELPELFEEDVAEDDEARADEGEAGRSGIDGSQHSPIVRRQTSGDLPRRRHFLLSVCFALIVTIQSRLSVYRPSPQSVWVRLLFRRAGKIETGRRVVPVEWFKYLCAAFSKLSYPGSRLNGEELKPLSPW